MYVGRSVDLFSIFVLFFLFPPATPLKCNRQISKSWRSLWLLKSVLIQPRIGIPSFFPSSILPRMALQSLPEVDTEFVEAWAIAAFRLSLYLDSGDAPKGLRRPGPVQPFDSFSIRSFLSFSILRLFRLWTSGFAARTGAFFVSFFSVIFFSYANFSSDLAFLSAKLCRIL